MEGGKEERETTPPEDHRRQAGPESARREARVGSTAPRGFPPPPEPRAGAVAGEARGFTRRERTPNVLSRSRARASKPSGVPRARTEARGGSSEAVSDQRVYLLRPMVAVFCCLFVACAKPETWPSPVCPPSLGFSRPRLRFRRVDFTSWRAADHNSWRRLGKKGSATFPTEKSAVWRRSPGGGWSGAELACLGLVGARGERDQERDGTMTAMRLVGNGLAKR